MTDYHDHPDARIRALRRDGRPVGQIKRGLEIPKSRDGFTPTPPKHPRHPGAHRARSWRPVARLPRGHVEDWLEWLDSPDGAEERKRWRDAFGLTRPQVEEVTAAGRTPARLAADRQHVARVFAHFIAEARGAVGDGQGRRSVMVPVLAAVYGLTERAVRKIASEAQGPPERAQWHRRMKRQRALQRAEDQRAIREAAEERRERKVHRRKHLGLEAEEITENAGAVDIDGELATEIDADPEAEEREEADSRRAVDDFRRNLGL
jgi:hypothetical protein